MLDGPRKVRMRNGKEKRQSTGVIGGETSVREPNDKEKGDGKVE